MSRFVIVSLVLWLILTVGAALLSDALSDTDKQQAHTRHLGVEFDLITQRAQTLAGAIAQDATQTNFADLRANLPKLIQRFSDGSSIIAGVGVWPLPNTLDATRERASVSWLRDSSGVLQLREDYNDPRAVPYFHEKWFTPARYSPRNRCYWSPPYQEPLLKTEVSTCAFPVHRAQGFVGVVTVTLNLKAVADTLGAINLDDHSYSILTTLGGDVLAVTGSLQSTDDEKPLRTLADLAREHPQFSPMALQLHQQHANLLRAAAIGANQINALKNDTRGMSREEAESALVNLALTAPEGMPQPTLQRISIANAGVLGGASDGYIFSLPGQWWTLTSVSMGHSAIPGFGWISASALALSGGFLAFICLMLWVLNLWVLQPLHAMTQQMAATASARDSSHELDDSATHELGALAHWHNVSLRLLREQVIQMRSAQTQLRVDHGERRSLQDATLKINDRIAERNALALQSISEGVIILNEQARIEGMNTAAEKIIGIASRNAVGKAFNDVFQARHQKDLTMALPNLVELAMQQQGPMEFSQGVKLLGSGNTAIDIHLGFYPLLNKQGGNHGWIAIFRRRSMDGIAAQTIDHRTQDSISGLPMRESCEYAIRALIEEARLVPQQHALLFINVDNFKNIDDTQGQRAGDEVITQIAGVLLSITSQKDRDKVYRLYGDKFAIVLQNTELSLAKVFAEEITGRFANAALRGQNSNSRITVSIGLCMIDGASPSSFELLRRSELACTMAKHTGGNHVQEWLPSLDESLSKADDDVWIKRIRAGLAQDKLHLTTQMLAPLSSKDAPAFQMIMALEDEEGFWSAPSAFLPSAQRHNLGQELDQWLVNSTISQLKQHPEILERLSFITICLSESALSDNHLLGSLMKFFSECPAILPSKICFEFSETALQKHFKQTQIFCETMRGLNSHLCMDGFLGRRTSDIAQLRTLPIDFIRVDTARFPNIETDTIERMLAESLIQVVRSLGKSIIAANVDTQDRLSIWQKLEVNYLQGLAVSKPSPVIFSGLS
jgi:diguanylate cyclase (GGDEF)-like protein